MKRQAGCAAGAAGARWLLGRTRAGCSFRGPKERVERVSERGRRGEKEEKAQTDGSYAGSWEAAICSRYRGALVGGAGRASQLPA